MWKGTTNIGVGGGEGERRNQVKISSRQSDQLPGIKKWIEEGLHHMYTLCQCELNKTDIHILIYLVIGCCGENSNL